MNARRLKKGKERERNTVFLPAFVVLDEVGTVANFFEHLDFFEKAVARMRGGGKRRTGRSF